MDASRKLHRRTFLAYVTGGTILGGATFALSGEARAFQHSDHDRGPHADRGAHSYSGGSDDDRGPNADLPGRGRGVRRGCPTGTTGTYRANTAAGANCERGGPAPPPSQQ